MPNMSSTDATIHASQYLICALQNPAPANPILKIGNAHREALRCLAEILTKSTPPAVPPRVPVRGAYQEKLQQVDQEITQMKNASQSNPLINAEPLRVPIANSYPW